MRMVDIGVNLAHRSFRDDLDEVLARAEGRGVQTMIVTGTNVAVSEAAAQLAEARRGLLFSTAGIHPHDAASAPEGAMDRLRAIAAKEPVVAIGECGLDFHRNYSPRPAQEAMFEAQIALAQELNMPLFCHERDASTRFVEIVRGFDVSSLKLVVHCFTGGPEALEAYLDFGFYIGVTGWICDERRGQTLRDLVSKVPANRLMVETDAPYLLPRTIRPKPKSTRNEPAHLVHVVKAVAEACGVEEADVARQTRETAVEFFGLGDLLASS